MADIEWSNKTIGSDGIEWEGEAQPEGPGYGRNLAGSAEAVLTAPIRLPLGVGMAAGRAGMALLGGEGIDKAADESRQGLSDAFSKGYLSDRGAQAMEALGHYAYEEPRAAVSDLVGEAMNREPKYRKPRSEEEKMATENMARLVVEGGLDVGLLGGVFKGALGKGKETPKLKPTFNDIEWSKVEPKDTTAATQGDLPLRFDPREGQNLEQPLSTRDPSRGVQESMFPDEAPRGTINYERPELTALNQEQHPAPASQMASIDFPLRQEVLDAPEMRQKLDSYQRWVDQAKQSGDTALENQLRMDFAEEMQRYGVKQPEDAFGRSLYEPEAKSLPIEKTNRPDLGKTAPFYPETPEGGLRVGGKFAPQADEGMGGLPIERTAIGVNRGLNRGTFGQSGGVDFSAFRRKDIPVEERLRIELRNIAGLREEIKNVQGQMDRARVEGNLRHQRDQMTYRNMLQSMVEKAQSRYDKTASVLKQPKGETKPYYSQRLSGTSRDPFKGPGRGQAGAVKLPGGNWRNEAKKRIADALGVRPEAPNMALLEGILPQERREMMQLVQGGKEHNAALDKMVNHYVNRYLGTSKDPLKDFRLPNGERWEDLTDTVVTSNTLHSIKEKTFKDVSPGSAHMADVKRQLEQDIPGVDRLTEADDIWEVKRTGRSSLPEVEGQFNMRSRANAWDIMQDWLIHVGEYFDRLPPEQKARMDMARLFNEVKRRDEAELRAAEKRKGEVAKRSMENATVVKEYDDGFKWIKLDKPGQFALESDMMGHSVRGYEPHPKSSRRNVDGGYVDQMHPDWVPESGGGGYPNYGHGGWEAIKRGDAEVYSLRDPKGEAHVTVEVHKPLKWNFNKSLSTEQAHELKARDPKLLDKYNAWFNRSGQHSMHYAENFWKWLEEKQPALFKELEAENGKTQEITQIKGKGNKRPEDKYQSYVTDFIKSKDWADVRDLHNTNVKNIEQAKQAVREAVYKLDTMDEIVSRKLNEKKKIQSYDSWLARAYDKLEKMFGAGHQWFDKAEIEAIVHETNPSQLGKKEGGVIHPDLLTFGVNKLLSEKSSLTVVRMFKGIYNPSKLESAIRDSQNNVPISLVWMSPDDFHKMAYPRTPKGESHPSVYAAREGRMDSIRRAVVDEGSGLDAIPMLRVAERPETQQGVVLGHDGRHRMDILKEQGLDKVPVVILGKRDLLGKEVITEDGSGRVRLPGPIFHAANPMGHSQRGVLNFDAFMKQLPENWKDEGKKHYEQYLASLKGNDQLPIKNPVQTAMAKVPGVAEALKYIAPELRKWEEGVKEQALSEPDISWKRVLGVKSWSDAFGRNMTPGAMMTGWAKKNTLIKYVGEKLNQAKVTANAKKMDFLLDKDTGMKSLIEALDKKGRSNVWKHLTENEGKATEDLSRLSPQEKAVVSRFREITDHLYDEFNKAREARGMKPIPKRDMYVAGIFNGDFQFIARDAKGEVVYRTGRNTKIGAERVRQDLLRAHPDWSADPVQHRPLSSQDMPAVNEVWHEIMTILPDDDPLITSAKEIFGEIVEQQAYEFTGVKKHFMPKKKEAVKGAAGFDPMKSEKANQKEFFQAQLRYFEHAFDWIELQKAGSEVRKALRDPEITKAQPEALKYAQLYWDVASGRGTRINKALNDITQVVAEWSGLGGSMYKNSLRNVKTALTLKFLETPIFLGVQAYQPIQMMPQWLMYLESKGVRGNPAYSAALGSADLTPTIFGDKPLTKLGQDALKWADENHRLDSFILDDVRDKTLDKFDPISIREIVAWPIQKVEVLTRRQSFLTMSHFLHEAGMELGPHLYETAMNLSNMLMTDYRIHERPLAYQQLGVLGEAMSTLTAFKHNQYGQLMGGLSTKEASRGAFLGTMVASQLIAGGLLGFYFRDEIDSVINTINMAQAGLGHETRIPTIRETLLTKGEKWDWLSFGGVSKLTDMDMSSRFSAGNPIPDSIGEGMFSYGSDIGRMATSTVEFAKQPNPSTRFKALHSWAPNALKFPIEKYAQKVMEEQHTVDGVESDFPGYNPQTEKGKYRRDKKDEVARYLGGRSLKESRDQAANNEAAKIETFHSNRLANIIKKAERDPSARQEMFKLYMRAGGTRESFMRAIDEYESNLRTTDTQRAIGKNPNTLKELMKAKRRQEFDKK